MSQEQSDAPRPAVEVPAVVISAPRWRGWALVPSDTPLETQRRNPDPNDRANIIPKDVKRARKPVSRFHASVDKLPRAQRQPRHNKHPVRPKTLRLVVPDEQSRIQNSSNDQISVLEAEVRQLRTRNTHLERQNAKLQRQDAQSKRQNALLAIKESDEIKSLMEDVNRLQEFKAEQNRKMEMLQTIIARLQGEEMIDSNSDGSASQQLKSQRKKLAENDRTIQTLKARLSERSVLQELFSNIGTEYTSIPDFRVEMEGLEKSILLVASLLANCLKANLPRETAELARLIPSSIGSLDTLVHNAQIAFRALVFHIIVDQVMHSDIWTALHFNSPTLRHYQKVIQSSGSDEFVETFHRVAFSHMLEHSSEFEKCVLPAYANDVQDYILDTLSPLLDNTQLKSRENDLQRELTSLLSRAFSFRARCIPPDGDRYEIIQFRPGDQFDSSVMEAQDAMGTRIVDVDGLDGRPIKLCVHGMMIGYQVQETLVGLDKIKALAQPFVPRTETVPNSLDSVLGGKTIVILENY